MREGWRQRIGWWNLNCPLWGVICTERAREGLVKAGKWAVGGERNVEAARWVVELTPP